MKVNLDFDCTPQEARALMGLPDLTPLHDKYVGSMMDLMEKGVTPDMVDSMIKGWSPMGDAGLNLWKKMFESAGKSD